MTSTKNLIKIMDDIYKQMYRESDPPGDLEQIAKSGEGSNENWFLNYYLSEKRQNEIIEEHFKKHKLTKREQKSIYTSVILGYAPRGHKEGEEYD